ncbi:hypothetical protein GCM10027589_56410 [Actinocorallia lasiicapitis]
MRLTRTAGTAGALAIAAGAVLAAAPAAAANTYGMKITMSGDHARPLPGERQTYRLTVRNTGKLALSGAWVALKRPKGWTAKTPGGCHREGRRVVCGLGRLAPGQTKRLVLRMTVPSRPRYGKVMVTAFTGAKAFEGPVTCFNVHVVRARN